MIVAPGAIACAHSTSSAAANAGNEANATTKLGFCAIAM